MIPVFADPVAYEDIRAHGGDTMDDVTLIPVVDVNDLLAKLSTLGPEDVVIAFLAGKGYKGENLVISAKIKEDHPSAPLPQQQ